MRILEGIIRFIGCFVVSYFISVLITAIVYRLFGASDFTCGLMVGGGTAGLMVYYYQNRKHKNNFVQSC